MAAGGRRRGRRRRGSRNPDGVARRRDRHPRVHQRRYAACLEQWAGPAGGASAPDVVSRAVRANCSTCCKFIIYEHVSGPVWPHEATIDRPFTPTGRARKSLRCSTSPSPSSCSAPPRCTARIMRRMRCSCARCSRSRPAGARRIAATARSRVKADSGVEATKLMDVQARTAARGANRRTRGASGSAWAPPGAIPRTATCRRSSRS